MVGLICGASVWQSPVVGVAKCVGWGYRGGRHLGSGVIDQHPTAVDRVLPGPRVGVQATWKASLLWMVVGFGGDGRGRGVEGVAFERVSSQ